MTEFFLVNWKRQAELQSWNTIKMCARRNAQERSAGVSNAAPVCLHPHLDIALSPFT